MGPSRLRMVLSQQGPRQVGGEQGGLVGWAEGSPVRAAGRRGTATVRSPLLGPSDTAAGTPGCTARPRPLGTPAPPQPLAPASSITVHSKDLRTLSWSRALPSGQLAGDASWRSETNFNPQNK